MALSESPRTVQNLDDLRSRLFICSNQLLPTTPQECSCVARVLMATTILSPEGNGRLPCALSAIKKDVSQCYSMASQVIPALYKRQSCNVWRRPRSRDRSYECSGAASQGFTPSSKFFYPDRHNIKARKSSQGKKLENLNTWIMFVG